MRRKADFGAVQTGKEWSTQIACSQNGERHRLWNMADMPKALVAFPPAGGVSWQYWIPLNKNSGGAQDLAQLRDG